MRSREINKYRKVTSKCNNNIFDVNDCYVELR